MSAVIWGFALLVILAWSALTDDAQGLRRTPLKRKTPLRPKAKPDRPRDPVETPVVLNPGRRLPQPRRVWTAAREKVDAEERCRVCKSARDVQAAHVTGRRHDVRQGGQRVVDAVSVVPLCRRCHEDYDAHRLDLLPHLSLAEQLRAVEDLGGIANAYRRTTSTRPEAA